VVVAASDVGPWCHWRGGGVGHSLPLVPFVGGVLLWSCGRLVVWCCPAVVVAWSSSVVVVAADVVFLCRSDGVLACPGGCWWWVVVWR